MTTAVVSPVNRLVTLPTGLPDLTLGDGVLLWARKFLVQPNGPRAGRGWTPTDEQARFMLWWYSVDEDGRWLYDRAARRLAKGSGKSPFAAVLALCEFLGPVRLHDFDPAAPGGCVGRAVNMPLVQIAATAETQTSNTMRMVRAFAPKGSKLVQEYRLDPGKTQYYRVPEGELKVITSSYTAAEGAEATFQVADETEHWMPANGGVELFSTLVDNLVKSGSRLLETSNAWKPGVGSVAEATYDDWLAQEEERYRADTRILYDARIAPPDTNPADPNSLLEGLEFVYGDSWWIDTQPILQRFWTKNAKPDDNKRKYLNWPTASQEAWIEPEDWTRLARPDIVVEPDDRVVLFFDGSKSKDATALIGCRVSDGHVFTLGVWEPDPNDPLSTVDVGKVDSTVVKAFDTYQVAAFFGDVREWESWVLAEWPNRYKEDLELWAVPTGRPPQAVAWDMRANTIRFGEAVEACRADILEGSFTHDGHPATARHVFNCRNREYKGRMSIGKESPNSPLKIDAGVCVVGARMVRRLVPGEAPKKRSGKVW